MKIKELEKIYFSLLPKEDKNVEPDVITFSKGDWIWSEYFKTANKVKCIKDNDSVFFYFNWADTKDGYGTYTHFSNNDGIGRHRKATKEEIKIRLKEEIKHLYDAKENQTKGE